MADPITLVLAEDHGLVRGSLLQMLRYERDLRVIGEAHDADAALVMVQDLRPRIALWDIDMPGVYCFEAIRQVHAACPEVRVVLFSAFVHDRYVNEAFASGVWGYVSKSEPPAVLLEAIRSVAGGRRFYSPHIQARLVIDRDGPRLADTPVSRLSLLTAREIEILRCLAQGMAKKEIAQQFHLSVMTVSRHTTNIMNKLDLHDRVELARYAIREKLVTA